MPGSKIKFIIFLAGVFFLNACDDTSDCRFLDNRKVKLVFVKNNKSLSDTTIKNLIVFLPLANKYLYSSEISSNKQPATIQYSDSIASQTLNLNLSQNSDTTIFILQMKAISDTIAFFSTRKLEMISADCGFNTRFKVDSVLYTTNNIVKILQIDPSIDKDILENFAIVVKTASAQDTLK